eukprot:4111665-Amphidinium_carterae.1
MARAETEEFDSNIESSWETVEHNSPSGRIASASITSTGTQVSLPLAWGLGTTAICIYGDHIRAYVIWRSGDHPLGPCYWSGVHIGGPDLWARLCECNVFVDGGYQTQRDHCRRVRECDPGQGWVRSGIRLYKSESGKHRAPAQAQIWLWNCERAVDHSHSSVSQPTQSTGGSQPVSSSSQRSQ